MKLYYFETPNGRKACAVAKLLDSPVEWVRINLANAEQKTDDFLAVNPNGRIPALVDGDVNLWESQAIMCYLARKAGSDIWPDDERQIDIIKWFNWDTAHFSRHAATLVWENVIKGFFGLGDSDAAAVESAIQQFNQFAPVLDQHLAKHDYAVGDKLTVADFSLGAFLPNYEAAKIPLNDYPNIKRWHERLMEIPAWKDPFPG